MKWLSLIVGVFVLSLFSSAGSAQKFVGAETCKSCHLFEYMQWSKGPHAQAETSLTEHQLGSAKCATCHTTSAKSSTLREFAGVQCESCHGPGQYYHPAYVMKDKELAAAVGLIRPTASDCESCHTAGAPSIRLFDFEKFWSEIDHGAGARAAWETKNASAE